MKNGWSYYSGLEGRFHLLCAKGFVVIVKHGLPEKCAWRRYAGIASGAS